MLLPNRYELAKSFELNSFPALESLLLGYWYGKPEYGSESEIVYFAIRFLQPVTINLQVQGKSLSLFT